MNPLKKSWAATQLEDELRNLFIKLYEDHLGEKADEINVYGAPHIGPFTLVEREVAKDGLAVLRTTDEEAIRYLFKAWRFQNPRRGMHFLRTYLQVLFGSSHEVMQLWQQKNQPYPHMLRPAHEVVGTPLEATHYLTSRIRVDIDAEYVPAQLKKTLRTALAARLVMDVRAAKYGQSTTGMAVRAGMTTVMRSGNIEPPPKYVAPPETGTVSQMLYDLWSYIVRATGQTAIENSMPMLITSEGMVKNNQFTGGALGGYTADGVTSSEGISLLMRGLANAYKFDKDAEKLAYMKFLMDAACKYYFFDTRPTADAAVPWYHTWMVNAGAAFDVRGPLASNGQLDQGGYIGRAVDFTNGVGYLSPPPDILYQVATDGTRFVWNNVFSDIVAGTGSSVAVEYYINAAGHKVFGTQKGGSFGQPIQENSGETPGKVVLTTNLTGNFKANYAVTVIGETIAYGDVYEAWPMWRRLAPSERSIAADAIHWFVDAFRIMMEVDPTNAEWRNAHARMLDVWRECCDQESNNTSIFLPGASGQYNNFPLTYSYGYGVHNVDDDTTQWEAIPPSDMYTAARTTDGYVTFTAPAMNSPKGSGGPMRYGIVFENDPLYLNYTPDSSIHLDMRASEQMVVAMTMKADDGETFEATVLAPVNAAPVSIGISQFMRFQQAPGDATGDRTGDWDDWEMPIYDRVPFPGRRLAIVGDSISAYNSVHVDPKGTTGRYETYGFGFAGYWTNADQILGGRLLLEPGIQPDTNGQKRGYNFAIAGTKVANWWKEQDDVLNDGKIEMGPMFAALNNLPNYDVVVMMGGTNDLAGNETADKVLLNLKKASTDLAKNGKWVFLMTISPRTRDLLQGYTLEQQDAIRARLQAVNDGLRTWVSTVDPGNIFLVDTWDQMVGPNGIDPAGLVSSATSATAASTHGNYRPDAPSVVFAHDGLHPGPAGGYAMGKVLAEAMVLAGIPARTSATTLGPYTLGTNLLANPNMVFTQLSLAQTPPSYNYTNIGWATGLGTQVVAAGNLHNGYTHGKLPDNWHFYRSSNSEAEVIGYGPGGTYSNFQAYTWADLAGQFPSLTEYMDDSTWSPGAVKVSIIDDGGVPALRVDVNIPQTGNKNEAFVIATFLPKERHGPWDNYGYLTPDQGTPPVNTLYGAGDVLHAEMDLTMTGLNHSLTSCRLTMNLYGNAPAQDGANMTSLGNHPTFWPPSDMDNCRMHPENRAIKLRAPAVRVPPYESGATLRYAELRLEVSFDASTSGATGSFIIKNPSVRKMTGSGL